MAVAARVSSPKTVLPASAPLPAWRCQVQGVIAVCAVVGLLVWVANYKQGVFGPLLVHSLLLAAIIYAVASRKVGQLFDIFTPNSAAEAGVYRQQCQIGRTHFTLNWLVNLSITLACWLFLFVILWQIAWSQAAHYDALQNTLKHPQTLDAAGLNALHARLLEPLHVPFGERPPLLQRLDGHTDNYKIHFLFLTLWTWLIWWLPCGVAILLLWNTQRRYSNQPDRVDYHSMAMLTVCGVLGTISLSITEFWLGLNTRIGGGVTLLSLVPPVIIVLRLFSPWRWTEGGKAILNVDSECREHPLKTLDFLEVPAAQATSRATRGHPQTAIARNPGHDGPVVIICASGGGSRAALFTAGILSRMWWQNAPEEALTPEKQEDITKAAQTIYELPSELDDAGKYQAEAVEEAVLYPGRLLLQCADAISSVSGGSLAAAYYVESLHRYLRNESLAADPLMARWQAMRKFFDPTGMLPREARPVTAWYNKIGWPQSLSPFFVSADARLALLQIGDSEERQRQYEANPFINAMAQDHLAACISGFFIWRTGFDRRRKWAGVPSREHHRFHFPFYPIGRGPNIEKFWEQSFAWYGAGELTGTGDNLPVRLSDFYEAERSGALPSLILNATLAGTGTRLAITNLDTTTFQESAKFGPWVDARDLGEGSALDLPDEVAPDARDHHIGKGRQVASDMPPDAEAAERQAAHRFDPLPAQINTLNSLDNFWDIPLKSAVRASANFPFGFPLMRFRRYKIHPDGSGGEPVTHSDGTPDILDICDGGVLDNTGVDSALALLRANRDEVRKRGVLIFQIDSGELPRNPGLSLLDSLLYNLSAVLNGIWRTNLNTQAALHSEYLEELRALFEAELEHKDGGERGLKPLQPVVGTTENGGKYTLGFEGDNVAFYAVRAGELNQEHVMTSWHLDACQRALLHDETLQAQQGQAILQASAWFARRLRANLASAALQQPLPSPHLPEEAPRLVPG